ncbi:uncharacterized protein LOC144115122 [Amblyomma americanum]|uniref:Uncharacterized protein n=1 Tax=Amblyomma americanum TaxID=6943 RepID=A0AAQ4F4X3_AMBAM
MMSSSEYSEGDSLSRSDESLSTEEDGEDIMYQLSVFWPYPKGPDASLRKGPSLANLSKRPVLCKGPNPQNRRGPDPSLRNGPDPKNHSGIKWRADCTGWKGPKADAMLVLAKPKKRRRRGAKHAASSCTQERTEDDESDGGRADHQSAVRIHRKESEV